MSNNALGSADFTLNSFSGIVPEMSSENLPEGAASRAINCDFYPGAVKTRPGIVNVYSLSEAGVGPNSPSLGSNIGSGTPWVNPQYIEVDDTNYAVLDTRSNQGPIAATTQANSNALGTLAWTLGTVSSVAVSTAISSQILLKRGFVFAPFTGATITGVSVTFDAKDTTHTSILTVLPIQSGAVVGTAKTQALTSTYVTYTLGSSSDFWGTTYPSWDNVLEGFGFMAGTLSRSSTVSVTNVFITLYANLISADSLAATAFAFSFPLTDGITGAAFQVTAHMTGTGQLQAQLLINDVPVGNTKLFTPTSGDTIFTLGSSSDTWGASVVAASINNTQYGLAITPVSSSQAVFYVQYVSATTWGTQGIGNFNFVMSYPQDNGNLGTLALDALGTLYVEDAIANPDILTNVFGGIFPDTFGKGCVQNDRAYFALSNLLNGTDMPRQWDGTNLDRISQVGPGAPPTITSTQTTYAVKASPSGVTQPAAYVFPYSGSIPYHSYASISAGIGIATPGNVVQIILNQAYKLPAGMAIGDHFVLSGFSNIAGTSVNINNGGANPAFWTATYISYGPPPTGQTNYTALTFVVPYTALASGDDHLANGSTLQQTIATVTTTTPVANLEVGSSFSLSGIGIAAWDNTYTVVEPPGIIPVVTNAAQMQITGTSLTSNVASYSYNLISGSTPTAGDLVTVTLTTNGNGIFNVANYAIVSATSSVFKLSIISPDIPSAAEAGSAIIFGTIFQFDPAGILTNPVPGNSGGTASPPSGNLSLIGLTSSGPRQAVCIFQTRNGAQTAPSIPITFFLTNNANSIVCSNIPIGPPDTTERIIAFTAGGGSSGVAPANFFYIPENVIVTSFGVPVVNTATVVPDNVSTQATFSFSDVVLLSASAIDIQGNNLFNQVELGSCLAVGSYASRLYAIGVQNKIQNLVNMSFDGGTLPSNPFPLGWVADPVYSDGGKVMISPSFGDSYYIQNIGGSPPGSTYGLISQSAFQDYYSIPIININTTYSLRVTARSPSGTLGSPPTDALTIDLYSPSFNKVFGSFTQDLSSMSTVMASFTGTLLTTKFTTAVPSDLRLRVYLAGSTVGADVEIDRIEPFDPLHPVLTTSLVFSYVDNFEAFDAVNSILGCSTQNQQPIVAAYTISDTLYIVKTGSIYSTTDNGITEPGKWTVKETANNVGGCSINCVWSGEEYAFVAGRAGVYIHLGGAPIKISQEIQPIWDALNWKAAHTIWLRNDIVNRRFLIGVPLPTPNQWFPTAPVNANPIQPNVLLVCNYREVASGQDLAQEAPIHITYTNRIVAKDLARKWSIWTIASPYADFIQRADGSEPLFICNGDSTGKIYQFEEGTYNDDGAVIPTIYGTFGFIRQQDAQGLQIGQHNKTYVYSSHLISGNGHFAFTEFMNKLDGANKKSIPAIPLVTVADFNTEIPLNITALRLFLQYETNAVDEWFQLSEIVMNVKADPWSPVRGRNG